MNALELELKTLVKFLSAEKIKYVILGGIAVSIYGEPRLTADIDVNIIFNKKEITEFLGKARRRGFYPLSPNIKEIVDKAGVIPLKFAKGKIKSTCDIIIAENILEYQAIKRARLKKLGTVKARVVSPEDLIIHKITSSRPRDIEDLKGILIRQKGKLDIKYIIKWLKIIDKANKKSDLYSSFNRILKNI